jgi:chromate reductase, NAD(P)H dehydrogenase (quinone)
MPEVIIGLVGSLRQGSYNRRLLNASMPLLEPSFRLEIHGLDGIPLYDGDAEARSGLPPAVTALKERIAPAAALLIASPEYNNGIPGPLKNAIDWLSRPVSDIPRIFGGRIVGVIGASPGRFGTLSAQQGWLPVFRTLGVVPYFGRSLTVGGASTVFGDDGSIIDAGTRERLGAYLEGFRAFVQGGAAASASSGA